MADLTGCRLGRYQLEELLGRGGMAEVYKAHDEKLDRAVAVKVIRPVHAEDEGFLERFLREARLVAQLEHAHILPVYDFGEEQGRPYLVMPLVHGGTLLERLQAASPPRALISEWLAQLGSALDAAHAKGILHRDIKPANVLVGEGDRLLLADFGIARMWHSSTGLTATGTVVGTPIYLAPEVAQGAKASPASDRYSLAVIAYEMIGGSPPFRAENPLSILHQHVTSPVPALALRMGDLPPEVDTVFLRALAKAPEERPRSGRELALALGDLLSGEDAERTLPLPASSSHLAPTRPARPIPPTAWQPTGGPMTPPPTGIQRLGRLAFWGLAVVVLILVGLSALQFLKLGGESPSVSGGGEQIRQEPVETADQTSVANDVPVALEHDSALQGPPSVLSEPETEGQPEKSMSRPIPRREGRDLPDSTSRRGPAQRANPPLEEIGKAALDRRLSRDDFKRMKEKARSRSFHPQAKVLEAYADGGLAYLDGRSPEAITILVRLLSNERSALAWGGSVVTLLREMVSSGENLTAWQVDLAYGDPGRLAGSRLAKARAKAPEDLGLLLGEAVLARLDGQHRKALERAIAVWNNERLKSQHFAVAQFIAEEYVLIDDAPGAMEWYKRSVEAAGPRGPFIAFQAAISIARDLDRPSEAARFMKVACDNGLQAACRELEGSDRPLAKRREAG